MSIGSVTFDIKLTFLIVFSTIVPMLDYYNHRIFDPATLPGAKAYDRIIFYFLIPLLIIFFLFRESPAEYGFQFGDWRLGLLYTVGACLIMSGILWFIARGEGMNQYYQLHAPENSRFLIYITAVDLWGWEFIWRGFMLFGMAKILGPGPAIFLQAVPFAYMHLGKPEIESLSTIFGGAFFGYVAWRTDSFLYPFLIHWYIASFTQLIALGKF